MELTIRAPKTRAVSSRELCRRMSKLLDEIESDGSGLVVLRHGRPTALLVPLDSKRRTISVQERERAALEVPSSTS